MENYQAKGPLKVHAANPRYFDDGSSRAIFLCGSHTWANWIEHKTSPGEPDFDFGAYLDFMAAHNHNFMRLWGWEHARFATWDGTGNFFAYPMAYARTGPGTAIDGLPKFDLTKFDPAYFERLRTRVMAAASRGIYVGVKLFEGFSIGYKGEPSPTWVPQRNPYRGHPFNAANNINGIDGDPDSTGQGKAIQTLRIPAITRLQEAFVRKVVDTINDLPNVMYEICNEADGTDAAALWQYHLSRYLMQYQAGKPNQHLVGMTFQYPGGTNKQLWDSPADWISPMHFADEPYQNNPPAADGKKIIIADTDHLWGHGGNSAWVWKSFTRGLHTLLMDCWQGLAGSDLHDNNFRDYPIWEPIRRSMGYARSYADRMNLAAMTPHGELCSTGYCLAAPGSEYLIYAPDGGTVEADLAAVHAPLTAEWFDPATGKVVKNETIEGGARAKLKSPNSGDVVMYLRTS